MIDKIAICNFLICNIKEVSTIERFEELEVWKVSMDLCTAIYTLTKDENFTRDFGLKDQIRRSAVSVPSNISEGYERDSKKQFLYFLIVAKGSCGELRTQLKIARNLNYLDEQTYITVNEQCLSVSRQLKGFINYLKQYNERNSM
jgi:four helix bundle protein